MVNNSRDSLVYTSTITGAEPGDTVRYYLFAADASGHRANHPFIGLPDPHQFVVNEQALHFEPDTVWFQTMEQMMEGITLNVINTTEDTVIINSITQFGLTFPWFVRDDDLPEFPFALQGFDTLSFPVYSDVPVYRDMVYDTMYIETPDKTYKELIMVNSELVDDISVIQSSLTITVYPNPFESQTTFRWKHSGEYSLTVFDLSGRVIFQHSGIADNVVWNSDGIVGTGVYVYRLNVNGKVATGKIIRK
jgi:hypothetical protein